MWTRTISFITPAQAAVRLRALGGLVFLDSAMRHDTLARHSFIAAAPFASFTVDAGGARLDGTRLDGPPLHALRAVLARYPCSTLPGLPPFQGGAAGMIGYDFAHHLERFAAPADMDPDEPSVRLGLYDTVLAFDLVAGTATLIASGQPAEDRQARALAQLDLFERHLEGPAPAPRPPSPAPIAWTSNFTRESYAPAIERVREYILSGDIYQANIAQSFEAELPADFDPFAFYLRLRRTNPAPFAAYLDYDGLAVASSSPERLMKLAGRAVETRPIKGTAPRGRDPAADAALGEALLASQKDRAENVMIVDLLRNDLARVAKPDSVEVPVLCGLETYASVHHLVSVVTATLKDGADALDLVGASFPGGSITGAPKIRAMDIITEIEAKARGPYCGSIGYLGFDGTMDLNIAIRTVTLRPGRATLQAGGGITVLSDPAGEYEETLTKAERIFAAFDMVGETNGAETQTDKERDEIFGGDRP